MFRATTEATPFRSSKFWIRKASLLASIASLILLIAPSPASADYILTHSGNSSGATGIGVDGTVSFAVLNTDNGTANDTWNTGFDVDTAMFTKGTGGGGEADSGDLDTDAPFLYLYQFVNDGTNTVLDILGMTLTLNGNLASAVTSWGYWDDLGFSDSDGDVDDGTPFGSVGTFGNPGAANTPVTDPDVVDIGNAGEFTPTSVVKSSTDITISFIDDKITDTNRSILVVFTSTVGPAFILTTIDDAGSDPLVTVPTLAPLPPALVMLLAGAPFGLLSLLRRRRNKH